MSNMVEIVCSIAVIVLVVDWAIERISEQRRLTMGNNNQIDNADYYRLPCGRYLEDYIWMREFSFAFGSAMKYVYRAGKKDGEAKDKDLKKAEHYIRFLSERSDDSYAEAEMDVMLEVQAAQDWDGLEVVQ